MCLAIYIRLYFQADSNINNYKNMKLNYKHLIIPAKARDYVFTGVGLSLCLSVCLFVCYHDN